MAWISTSTDTGYWTGGTVNLTTESSTAAVLWKWKSLLKTAGWFVAASYNGASGAKGQDILTGTVSNIPTSSWFVIAQPNSSRSIFVSRNTADGWRMKYSATGFDLTGSVTAQFPGPLVTGSNTLNRRVSIGSVMRVDGEICFLGSGVDASPTYISAPLGTINSTNAIVHIAAQNTEPYTFYILNYHSASTGAQPRYQVSGAMFLDCVESGSKAIGLDDYVAYCRIAGGGYSPMTPRAFANGAGQTAGFGAMINQTASFAQNTYGEISYGIQGVNAANAGTNGIGYQIPPGRDSSLTSYAISGVNGNVYNGNMTEMFPAYVIVKGRWDGNSSQPRESGYKGISSLFKWPGTLGYNGSDFVAGDTFSLLSSASRDYMLAGGVLVPWVGGVQPSGSSNNYRIMEGHTLTQAQASSSWFDGGIVFANTEESFFYVDNGPWSLFRGFRDGGYVYTSGVPPISASDIALIGQTFLRPTTELYTAPTASSNAYTLAQIVALSPTMLLDEREQTVVSAEFSKWNNQVNPSGGGISNYDNINVSAATRPNSGSSINGYSAPAFSGSRIEAMTQASGTWGGFLGSASGSYSVFVVARPGQISGSSPTSYLNTALWGDSAAYFGHYVNNVPSSSGIQFYNWDSNEKATTSIPIVSGTAYIFEGYYTSGSRSETRVNNYITQSAATIGTIGSTAGSWRLGGLGTSIQTSWNGEVASVLVFSKSLSEAEKYGIRLYLANKYAIDLIDSGAASPRTASDYFSSSLTIWSKTSAMSLSGTLINNWPSTGSLPNFFWGSGGSARPVNSIQNGQQTALFDGTNDRMASYSDNQSVVAYPFMSASGTGQWEILLVGIANALSGTDANQDAEVHLWRVETAASHGITLTISGARAYTTTGGTVLTPYTSGTLSTHRNFLVHAYYDGTNIACRLNDNTTVSASQTGNLTSDNQMSIGARQGAGNDYYYNGNINEFLMFSRSLNSIERAWARTYLGTKWGVRY